MARFYNAVIIKISVSSSSFSFKYSDINLLKMFVTPRVYGTVKVL